MSLEGGHFTVVFTKKIVVDGKYNNRDDVVAYAIEAVGEELNENPVSDTFDIRVMELDPYDE